MEFGPINLMGGILVALMLVPNHVYALRHPGRKSKGGNTLMDLLEQVGRYGSMALMVLPLGVRKFGFPSVEEMLLYLFGNGALLLAYWVIWILYFRSPGKGRALALAVIPTAIFLLSGLTLRHWLLAAAAALFGFAHIHTTFIRNL